jgi:pSer/pThr/pTyr-binding forkhead associated (FHA) protein
MAGLVAWAIMEPSAPKTLAAGNGWDTWERTFFFVYFALVGLVVGGYDGFVRGGKVHTLRGALLGGLFGIVGGTIGYQIGGRMFDSISGGGNANIAILIVARTIAFAVVGLFLGLGIGASSLTQRRAVQGAIGGAIGGGIGGAVFDVVGAIVGGAILSMQGQQGGEVGGPSRGIAFTLLAGMIALFIGIVERLTRSAWLRLSVGRNEGKEWSLEAQTTYLGRDERATIPLMGDPNVAPIHAVITRQGDQYVISDSGNSAIGIGVNGQRVGQAVLAPGAMVQIGSFNLQFLIKGTAAPAQGPEAYRAYSQPVGGPVGGPVPAQAPYVPPGQATQAPYVPQGAAPSVPATGGQPSYVPSAPTQAFAAQPAAPIVGFAVVAMDGPRGGQRFPVSGPMEVGREGSGIQLSDANTSRRHASFAPGVTGITVTDLGSTNGTFVNGQKIATAEARPGDVVTIGGTRFRVEAAP